MKQVAKFYLTSFLKNQSYFTPILVIFLQFYHLSFQEIFWVFTIGSIFSLIIEVPTGILADFFGKRKSIIISKFVLFVSFIIYGFSTNFWMFVFAQVSFELGNAFKSGTETAYIFDFLKQNKDVPSYTEVKGKQKFWARLSESGAAALGGVLAGMFGYNWVFFIASVPAFLNFVVALTWEPIKEREDKKINVSEYYGFITEAVKTLGRKKELLKITINITLFTAILASVSKFIQPYMSQSGIPIEYFGFIYAGSLIITALAVRYSYKAENRFGQYRVINWITLLSFIPLIFVGLSGPMIIGVFLLFAVTVAENIRSPIANTVFNDLVESSNRSTMGSILSLSKSIGKIIVLPVMGYVADVFSIFTAITILSVIVLVTGSVFYIRKSHCK